MIGSSHRMIVAVMGSQMSKTDGILLNIIGWKLDDDPQPVIYFGPTEKNVKSISNDRINKMFRQVPTLWAGLAKGKKDSIYEKHINGVRLGFGWAGSPTELASHPAAVVLIDERDRMRIVKGEGDPVVLAKARISTYPNGKIAVVSTPLEGNVDAEELDTGLTHWRVAKAEDVLSPTWRLWQSGTRHEWAWPCPHCQEYHIPRFRLLQWDKDSDPERARNTAFLACPKCGGCIDDRFKGWMNDRGRLVAPGQKVTSDGEVIGQEPVNQIASFWISGLCSSWISFGERAHDYVKAARSGDPGEIQAVINTGMGELYRLSGEAPRWEQVQECSAAYLMGDVPVEVQRLVGGVDVQKDRLVYVVRGFAEASTSYLIERGEMWGDTDKPEVWNRLSQWLAIQWGGIPLSRIGIDSGYRADQVYEFCRRHPGIAIPTKGQDTLDKPFKASLIDVNIRGKLVKKGLQLWHYDAGIAKSWVHSRVEWPQDQPGAWRLPSDIDEDYCRQIVSEQRLTAASGRASWIKISKDNHFLDCECIAYTVARIIGADRLVSAQNPHVQPQRRRIRSKGLGNELYDR